MLLYLYLLKLIYNVICYNRHERSETERKRLSKNRLSNRRSTGFVTPEEVEMAKFLEKFSEEDNKK